MTLSEFRSWLDGFCAAIGDNKLAETQKREIEAKLWAVEFEPTERRDMPGEGLFDHTPPEPHVARMSDELTELNQRIELLKSAIDTIPPMMTPEERRYAIRQFVAMGSYADILRNRLCAAAAKAEAS